MTCKKQEAIACRSLFAAIAAAALTSAKRDVDAARPKIRDDLIAQHMEYFESRDFREVCELAGVPLRTDLIPRYLRGEAGEAVNIGMFSRTGKRLVTTMDTRHRITIGPAVFPTQRIAASVLGVRRDYLTQFKRGNLNKIRRADLIARANRHITGDAKPKISLKEFA